MNPNPILTVFALFALGVTIRMAMRMYYGVRGPASSDPAGLVLRVVALLFLLSAWVAVGGVFLIAGFVLSVVLGFSLTDLQLARRRRQQNAAWSIVNRAIEHGHPIQDMLRSNLGRFTGKIRSAILSCVNQLSNSALIETAIADNPNAFPPEAQACAALSTGGGLPLPKLARAARLEDKHQLGPILQGLFYLVMIGLAAVLIATFVMISIVPEFEKIFYEFGLDLPPITQSVVSASNWFVNYWYLPLAPLLLFLAPLWVICSIVCWLAPIGLVFYLFKKNVFFFTVIKKLFYPYWFLITWLSQLFYPWHRYRTLNLLAVTVEERMPMEEAVRRLGENADGVAHYPNALVRRRMDRAHDAIVAGGDWREALQSARLLSGADVQLLRAAEPAGNTPWALRSIASRQLGRAVFRYEAWRQGLFATLILLFGGLVAWFVIALFIPLVRLIEGLV
ncbi:type IV pilin biogenesis protein [Planctomycetes bacterium MalM25]|nr:type IV pilin biogenesis protein [Planctomycetes bacterium MalM25]